MATVPRSEQAVRSAEAAAEGKAYCRVVAELLKALRVQQGYSLGQLAARSGVSRWTISRIEQRVEVPSAPVLYLLIRALGWTLKQWGDRVEKVLRQWAARSARCQADTVPLPA